MTEIPDRNDASADGGPDLSGSDPVLTMSGITKSFGDFLALDNVDFDLKRGEVHALLGENGAGKSSLMNVVAGLYAPDHGTVHVSGKAVSIKGPSDAQDLRIGMVHQHYKLVMPFSAVENILLSHPAGRYDQSLNQMREEIAQKAEMIGFDVDADKPVASLVNCRTAACGNPEGSGGRRQFHHSGRTDRSADR